MKRKHYLLPGELPVALALLLNTSLVWTPAQTLDRTQPGSNHALTLVPAETPSSGAGGAGDDEKAQTAELVKKSLNPVASLISMPFQNNWDFGIGPSDAMKYTLNFQPVIPITLNQMLKVGKQPLSLQLGYRYYADKPSGGPDWGLRFSVTFLFPR